MKPIKDYILRSLAVAAYFIAFYFSYTSPASIENPEVLSLIWGSASILYWYLTNEFEKRDRKWMKENK